MNVHYRVAYKITKYSHSRPLTLFDDIPVEGALSRKLMRVVRYSFEGSFLQPPSRLSKGVARAWVTMGSGYFKLDTIDSARNS